MVQALQARQLAPDVVQLVDVLEVGALEHLLAQLAQARAVPVLVARHQAVRREPVVEQVVIFEEIVEDELEQPLDEKVAPVQK